MGSESMEPDLPKLFSVRILWRNETALCVLSTFKAQVCLTMYRGRQAAVEGPSSVPNLRGKQGERGVHVLYLSTRPAVLELLGQR